MRPVRRFPVLGAACLKQHVEGTIGTHELENFLAEPIPESKAATRQALQRPDGIGRREKFYCLETAMMR